MKRRKTRKASTHALWQGRIGRVTAPEPHNPPMSRRAARVQRERDAQRALAPENGSTADTGVRVDLSEIAVKEPLPHTVPLPVIDMTVLAPPVPAELPLRSSGRRRTSTGPTPIRVGACGVAPAATRRAAKTAQLMAPPAPPARHARAAHTARPGIVAGLAVVVSLVLASTATVTAALSGPELYGVAEGRVAAVAAPVESAPPAAQISVPLPVPVEAFPRPAIEAAPAVVEMCSIPAFADALAAGDDAAAIAAAGGAEAFRAAVAGGTAPCVALDDPARVWVVLNKTRPNAPLDYRPAALAMPDGVRSIEGGSLRSDAASALSAMAGASVAAGAGEIALQSGFRSYATQQTTYGSQVDAAGRRGGRPRQRAAGLQRAPVGSGGRRRRVRGRVRNARRSRRDSRRANGSLAHSWEYGWITRYEDGYSPITGYSPEPWHLRYIGPELARAYHDGGWHTLEEFFGLPAAPTYL